MDEADESGDSSDPPKRFVRVVKKSARDVVQKFLQQLTKEKELNGTDYIGESSQETIKTGKFFMQKCYQIHNINHL
jgi:hypothetical protein